FFGSRNYIKMNDNNEQIKKDLEETSSKEKMLKGSAWMTAGSIFSRILGAIYIIPWATWFGVNYLQANALFTKGYGVYALFLMLFHLQWVNKWHIIILLMSMELVEDCLSEV